jgi:hypothetical protein
MYITIEETKGVSKSMLMDKLESHLKKHPTYGLAWHTKPVRDGSVTEWCYQAFLSDLQMISLRNYCVP